MPIEPITRRGLRPILSTSAIATSVTRMLVTDVKTVMASESFCVNPTACHSVDE